MLSKGSVKCWRWNGAYADLGEIGVWGASCSPAPGEWGSCDCLRLNMNEDGLASSLGMRERGWGPGMRMHSSSKRTPRASTLSTSAMDNGWEWGDIEGCGITDRSCHAHRPSKGATRGGGGARSAMRGHVFLSTPSTNHEPPLERSLSWPPKWRRCHNHRYCTVTGTSPWRSACCSTDPNTLSPPGAAQV